MRGVVVLISLYLITVQHSDACTCADIPINEEFCDSDFVLRVKMMGSPTEVTFDNSQYNQYTIQIHSFLKWPECEDPSDHMYVYRDLLAESCDVEDLLSKKNTYIIMGTLRDGRLSMATCGFAKRYQRLRRDLKHEFRRGTFRAQCSDDCPVGPLPFPFPTF